ncbi:homoserine kinase [Stackebrandtia nassauensis]|uniref:Homoserine kinase n=1 Tax=Stackebrandtia nassauensis (strain DSM 44728 / CIP 108903 / NRRL B-16338 / NBRC 102104 / LLR-40K-21) TaxID=446470 RepID=D3PU63_STANL|nr:homoserine kinase [Stackebrandtia nassauensis]ADD41009.1 homoserine kinase [Stackebrandtia nassauensis DSM 44728]
MSKYSRDPVTVRVPATSANLGPGFDSLGLSLSIYDEVTARVVDARPGRTRVTVEGEGADTLPSTEDHLVAHSLRVAAEALGGHPPSVELHCRNAIPQARGLGSSSAAIVAGVSLAAHLMTQITPDPARLLAIASRIEGHPDNVAPCLLGGFTVAWSDGDAARAVSREVVSGLSPVVYVPDGHGFTVIARKALPKSVSHADAAFNVSRAALAVCAFTTDASLLLEATDDRLHQTYRAASMPHTAALVTQLRDEGIPAMISGAGPSVLAFTPDPPVYPGFELRKLTVGQGARRIDPRLAPQVLPSG